MTENSFRQIALSFAETAESAHQRHPDFRVAGKIFATLGYPESAWGMVKLTPKQQESFVAELPEAFVPVKGAWGARGATSVRLSKVKKADLERALLAAWRNTAPKRLFDS
jgi:hypothetical protein